MSLDLGRTKSITLVAVLSTIIYVSQLILSFIPNVNVVTLLFVLYVYIVGYKKTTLILVVFTMLMGITYGFGYWLIGYIWIYSVLLLVISGIKGIVGVNIVLLAIVGLIYGFAFGFLFAINDHFLLGVPLLSYYIAGLWYDVIHALSNFLAIFYLFQPLYNIIVKENLSIRQDYS